MATCMKVIIIMKVNCPISGTGAKLWPSALRIIDPEDDIFLMLDLTRPRMLQPPPLRLLLNTSSYGTGSLRMALRWRSSSVVRSELLKMGAGKCSIQRVQKMTVWMCTRRTESLDRATVRCSSWSIRQVGESLKTCHLRLTCLSASYRRAGVDVDGGVRACTNRFFETNASPNVNGADVRLS